MKFRDSKALEFGLLIMVVLCPKGLQLHAFGHFFALSWWLDTIRTLGAQFQRAVKWAAGAGCVRHY